MSFMRTNTYTPGPSHTGAGTCVRCVRWHHSAGLTSMCGPVRCCHIACCV